ncbi:MAG: DUF3160 domain-containing protein [Verrucomicrobiales bacterium]|nr:DUF3160 domain-containing protein [Verrucomicrobiales bacterium]
MTTRFPFRGAVGMGVGRCLGFLGILGVLETSSLGAQATGPSVRLDRQTVGLQLDWQGALAQPDGTVERPWFEVQFSTDLRTWTPVAERVRASEVEVLRQTVSTDRPHGFYRILSVRPLARSGLGEGGAEVFGYADSFEAALAQIGQISTTAFAERFASGAEYLPGISWDPTTATFWDAFNADPQVVNDGKSWDQPGFRTIDYRLTAPELALFRKNGFVVSERLGRAGANMWDDGASIGNVFYQLWYNDLPVFVTTDAILHAWHRTYQQMLQELEETLLYDGVLKVVNGMMDQLPKTRDLVGTGVLRDSVLDADYFLTVARSLLDAGGKRPSPLGQDDRVAETLADIQRLKLKQVENFLGHCRVVDFSQFQVRGHYTQTPVLGAYFQAMMWLGRIDVPVAGGPFERCPGDLRMASPRELGLALVLHSLLEESGAFPKWSMVDRVIESFVGWNDTMSPPQLRGLLAGAGIKSLADISDLATLERIQQTILDGELGVQNIRSDVFFVPFNDSQPAVLPRSMAVFGQRFVPDSWAFSQTVFDAIRWTENGVAVEVQRRVPSALDAAFAVLANNQVAPLIVDRIGKKNVSTMASHADQFRDGLPYQHNLAAVRSVLDAQKPEAWERSIAMGWLASLRTLSSPTTSAVYPEAMRTVAWAMRNLNTQLASWTQYRHDTILYAKQSYTSVPMCFYPGGFVEPRPEFWRRLGALADRSAGLLEELQYPDSMPSFPYVTPQVIQSNQVAHLRRFAVTMGTLAVMSEKELARQPFSESEDLFLRNLMQAVGWDPFGSGRTPRFGGWYPGLFYRPIRHTDAVPASDPLATWYPSREVYFHEKWGANAADLLIADVHTDPPAPLVGDPGSVLHEAVGNAALMMVAIDNGSDRMIYAGPVMTHYELEVIGEPRRLTDTEWKEVLLLYRPPPQPIEGLSQPPWTKGYLVPMN